MNEILCDSHRKKAIVRCKNCDTNNLLCGECLSDHFPGHLYEDADSSKKDKLVQLCLEGWKTLKEKKEELTSKAPSNLMKI